MGRVLVAFEEGGTLSGVVTGQVLASNRAHAVRRPGRSVLRGAATIMSSQEITEFLKSIDTSQVVGLRDRAFLGVMVYAFARVSAVVGLKVEDYFPLKQRCWLRLHEKGGKVNEMGCHHKLEQFLDHCIQAAVIAADNKGPSSARPSGGRENYRRNPCRASTILTLPSAWPDIPTSRPQSCTTVAAMSKLQRD